MKDIKKYPEVSFLIEGTYADGASSACHWDSAQAAYGIFLEKKQEPGIVTATLTLVFKKPDSKRIQLLMHYNAAPLSDSP